MANSKKTEEEREHDIARGLYKEASDKALLEKYILEHGAGKCVPADSLKLLFAAKNNYESSVLSGVASRRLHDLLLEEVEALRRLVK